MSFAQVSRAAVLFDLDGTVADTVDLIVRSFEHALQTVVGESIPSPHLRRWIGRPLGEVFRPWPEQVGELKRVYREWNLIYHDELIRPYPGMAQLLAELRTSGTTTGVVTSKRRATAQMSLDSLGLAGVLAVQVAMEDTTEHKPHPAPLLLGCRRLGIRPIDTVYVGDAVVDVQAAKAAGLGSIAVTWGAASAEDLRGAGPDAVVQSVQELRALLREG